MIFSLLLLIYLWHYDVAHWPTKTDNKYNAVAETNAIRLYFAISDIY